MFGCRYMHLKLLDRVVSSALFLTVGVFECDIAHRWSVALRCMLYKIRRNLMHSLNLMVLYLDHGCHRGLHAVLWLHIGILICRLSTSQFRRTFIALALSVPLEWSCWPSIRWCGTCWFQEQGQCFVIGQGCSISTIVFYYFSLSLPSVYRLVLWGWGLRTDRVYITLSQPCAADPF